MISPSETPAGRKSFAAVRRRGTFRHVRDLVARIEQLTRRYNRHCQPFVWTATADSILAKIARHFKAVAGTGH